MRTLPTVVIACALSAAGPALGEEFAPMVLNAYSSVPHAISQAIVLDETGTAVGIVHNINLDRAGKPVAVCVIIAGGREISVPAHQASYDALANRVIIENRAQLADAR